MKIIKVKNIGLSIMIFSLFCFLLSGCADMNSIKVKFGLKNKDFEYINDGKVKKIVIQSTRDSGFRFEVTDKNTIADIYDILSVAKIASKKTDLKPDYTLELQESSKLKKKFYYIVGLDKRDYGNFYSDKKTYIVSKRIDDDMMKNFWSIGRPRDFDKVYYDSMITALGDYIKNVKPKGTIGVNIDDDVNVSRYILSVDVDNFKEELKDKFSNVKLIEDSKTACDVKMNITTEGYTTTVVDNKYQCTYKCTIKFDDLNQNKENTYYMSNKYKDNNWSIVTYKENKPSDF